MAKANQFHLAAETIATTNQDIADAYLTLYVHAGIAAADVICCARLGEHAPGDDHQEAGCSPKPTAPTRYLKVLIELKTRSGYSATPTCDTGP